MTPLRPSPLVAAVALVTALLAVTRAVGVEPPRPFESATAGLRISFPEGWEVGPGTGAVLATARSGARAMTLAAETPDGRREATSLSEEDVARLWSAALREIPSAPPDALPSGRGEATLGGTPARFCWIRLPGGGGDGVALMSYSVLAVHAGTFVRITLVAPQPEYRAARQAFDAALKSFAWLR